MLKTLSVGVSHCVWSLGEGIGNMQWVSSQSVVATQAVYSSSFWRVTFEVCTEHDACVFHRSVRFSKEFWTQGMGK